MNPEEKLIVALDYDDFQKAEGTINTLSGLIKIYKVGKELFTSSGPRVIEAIHATGAKVFLDLKYHDIPNTVGAACAAATKLGVFMLNVHALGGKNMLYTAVQQMHKTAEELNVTPPKLLAVTVLTSLTDHDLKEVGIRRKVKKEVLSLASLAKDCGLDGVVASGHEIKAIRRKTGKEFLIVTPGVRPIWAAQGDQKRIVTPREAIEAGADFIVIGRPITQDLDPRRAAQKILDEIKSLR